MKTFKFRIKPNRKVQTTLNSWFGQQRYIWNYYLNIRSTTYKDTKKSLSYVDNAKNLTLLKKNEDTIWLQESPSQTLQQTLKHLDRSFKDFFKGKGYPKFKKKGLSSDSLHFPQGFSVDEDKLTLPKIKKSIRIKKHREIQGNIRSIVVTKNSCNQYHVCIVTDYEEKHLPKSKNEIGIDVGLKHFLVASNGNKIELPHFMQEEETKLVKLQRQLSRKSKGSKNRSKARLKVVKQHLLISNRRKDFLHKTSTKLINENQVIAVEDLSIKNMVKNHKLSKAILNASWSSFRTMLEYKADWYGREIRKLDKFFPSSKMCNKCGYVKKDLKLSDRSITCKSCGFVYDRDENASKNILQFSRVGTTPTYACGDASDGDSRSFESSYVSTKQEALCFS